VIHESAYVRQCAALLWSELGVLVPATVAALLIAAPWLAAVGLGLEALAPLACALFGAPAWAGLVAVAATAARGESAGLGTLVRAVRHEYRRVLPLGAATAGFAWAFERAMVGVGEGNLWLIPVLAATGAATFIVLAIDLHAFPLLALHDAPLRDTVRAALALAAVAPGATLGLLGAGTLAYVALAQLGPGTLLLTLPILAVLHVNNTLLHAERLVPGLKSTA
jgi:uncharacterized membrane protein YesL